MKPREVNYGMIWAKAVDDQESVARKNANSAESWESQACRLGFGIYKATCFCERLAREFFSPWYQPTAVEAGRLYLLNKHHWAPAEVQNLQMVGLMAFLHEELIQMRLTKEEWEPVHNWTSHLGCYQLLAESAPLP